PFRFTTKRPPSVLVCGSGNPGGHDLFLPPSPCSRQSCEPLKTFVMPSANFAEDADTHWRPYRLFLGATTNAGTIGSHVSVLSAGHSPHPPHAHLEEEILLVLDGIAEIHVVDEDKCEPRVERIPAGSFVYYPAYQHHTIRNPADAPVTYLMFK